MDQSAFILARDRKLPIHALAAEEPGVLVAICRGEDVGTYIGPGISTVLE
jgi:uridylate kinase